MDSFYRITQPTGTASFTRQPRRGSGDDHPYGEAGARNRNGAGGEGQDGRDFASVLARMMAR